jgi:hypothetical protein
MLVHGSDDGSEPALGSAAAGLVSADVEVDVLREAIDQFPSLRETGAALEEHHVTKGRRD